MSEEPITLRFDSFRGFLEECSDRISEQGIFLATEEIRPVGSTIEFQIGIASDFPLLRGTGEVVWVVEPNGGGDAPGMAVRYRSTDDATMTLARKIAERQRERSGAAFDLERDAPDGPPPAGAGGESSEGESAADGPRPSLATQAVDALIEGPVQPEAEAVEAEPAAEPEPEPEPAPEPAPAAVPLAASYEPTEEMDAAPKRGRGGLWAALVLIAALAGAAYWQRDLLLATLGGSTEPEATAAAEPESVEPSIQTPVEPVVQAPIEPAIDAPEEPEGESELPSPADAAPTPTPTGPLTRIEDVRWEASVGVTLLELVADGAFAEDGYSLERLEDPPRLLLKIAGVTEPLPTPTQAVGSEEVVGIRTGLHGSPPESRLHVVVDLADPTAQVTVAEIRGAVLQLRVASSAISP